MMRYAVADYLLNAGWQLVLIAGGTLVLSRLLRLRPAQACWLWLAAFGLAALAPVLALAPGGAIAAGSHVVGHAWQNILVPPKVALGLSIGFWLCLAGAAVRLLVSCIIAIRLVRASRPVWLPDEVRESLEEFCRQHGRAMPRIHVCGRISSPVVAGIRRPFVLVPPGVLAEGPDALRPALLHELAHVMRGDYATNLMVELFALPLTWHPALHGIKAMIRLTREQSCDAMAAAKIGCRHRYAQSLLALARQAIAPKGQGGTSMAMFGDDDLHSRIALLAAKGERRRLAGLPAAATVAMFLLLGAVVTNVHVSALAPMPASVPVAAAQTPMMVMPPPHLRPFKPVRTARIEPRLYKPHGHAHSETEIAARTVVAPDIRVAQIVPSAQISMLDQNAGGEGPLDLLLPFQVVKYHTLFP
jgi:beta-lactamase regulating signal transducer with metallopeptidase domain